MLDHQLGGWMIWDLDFDDFNAYYCYQGEYPIHKLASKMAGYEITDPVTEAPPTPPSTYVPRKLRDEEHSCC